jgi:formylglycine-generating enzyme required for sulfatase activity
MEVIKKMSLCSRYLFGCWLGLMILFVSGYAGNPLALPESGNEPIGIESQNEIESPDQSAISPETAGTPQEHPAAAVTAPASPVTPPAAAPSAPVVTPPTQSPAAPADTPPAMPAATASAPVASPSAPTGPTGSSGAELSSLFITTIPAGAKVTINGMESGITDPEFVLAHILPGKYEIVLFKEKYYPKKIEVTLISGNYRYENVALQPQFGQLLIQSEPTGAKVSIGGKYVGDTPYSNNEYPSGKYLIEVKMDMYLPVKDGIEVKDGQKTEKNFQLKTDFAALSIISEPIGAEVYFLGEFIGATPLEKKFSTEGHGPLVIRKDGYFDYSTEANLTKGQKLELKANLSRILAKMNIVADPAEPDATIFIDDQPYGLAPQLIKNIPVGKHRVEVRSSKMRGLADIVLPGQGLDLVVKLLRHGELLEMVFIKGGEFMMGSNDYDNEKPVHRVKVSDFYLGKYEVTVAQYAKCVVEGACAKPSKGEKCNFDKPDRPNFPMNCITWNEATTFANWLSMKENLSICYDMNGAVASLPCNGYMLPTEAEWEFAARGGTKNLNYSFSGGNNLDVVGWYGDNSGDKTQPVGEKKANELGLYDMSGNVWEWVNDWYNERYYNESPLENPLGPKEGTTRISRGGSWESVSSYCRPANRLRDQPAWRIDVLGFRLKLSY